MSIACPDFVAAIDPALCRAIDHYCERTGHNWDAEPLNALTNLAFLIAGWSAWRRLARTPSGLADRFLIVVISVIPIVGLGSFVFHTLATRWAEWADVIPILLFMLLYLWLVLTRFFGWPLPMRLLALSVFCVTTFALEAGVSGDVLWGGAMYLPTVLSLVAIGAMAPHIDSHTRRAFFHAVGVFLFSFTMRTVDQPLCTSLPFGTHFLWHLLNATLLYLLVRVAILHGTRIRGEAV